MEARIILDSVSPEGIRLTTFHLRYWRPIHSELMTHRVFSRNARSSRAVPVVTLLSEAIFTPMFGINKPGMQSTELPSPELQNRWEEEWKELAQLTRNYVERWGKEGMHKQHANRPLEWFGWIDVLVTSTYWRNFYNLRIDSAAQPELRELATLMKETQDKSEPRLLTSGEWHLPYVSDEERAKLDIGLLLKLSTARCARLSYKPFDGNADYEAELKRYEKLMVSQPLHASPAEHQATPDFPLRKGKWSHPELQGNFHGWIQYRKTIDQEAKMEKVIWL